MSEKSPIDVVLRRFESPDETRVMQKGKFELVRIGGLTIGRATYEPGWRWSDCIKPLVGTDSCQVSHVGYAVSGRLGIRLADGTERTISAGESYTIPPGHDGWVEGEEPFVAIEVMSAEQFAKPQSPD